jgi:ankyrin repeat protein
MSSSFAINILLALGADLNARDGRGFSPMNYTARNRANDALRLLAQLGADSLAKSKIGLTILMCSTSAHMTELILRVVHEQILREDTSQKEEMTRAEDNAKKRLNDYLNQRDENGNTALHIASFCDDVERVCFLAEAGADINAKNTIEYTPLHYAVDIACVNMVMTLSHLGANMEGGEGTPKIYTPLMQAARANNVQLITTLINEGAKVYLSFSILTFPPSFLSLISHHNIEHCVKVENKFHGLTAVVWACEADSVEAIHRLKYHGADITKQQRNKTPLHWTASAGRHGATCALINLGADVHAHCGDFTPLMNAILWHHWHLVELLMSKYCAKVDNPNSSLICSALDATFQPNLAKRLKVIRFLLEVGVNVNARTVVLDATALFYATTREEVLELVKAGALVEAIDSQMNSPLFSAVINDR